MNAHRVLLNEMACEEAFTFHSFLKAESMESFKT